MRSITPLFRSGAAPPSRKNRSASLEVRRSSQYVTGNWRYSLKRSANSRVYSLCRALAAAQMQRFTDQQLTHVPPPGYLFQFCQIVPDTGSLERLKPLSSQTQFVTHRQTDALFTNVEREHTCPVPKC